MSDLRCVSLCLIHPNLCASLLNRVNVWFSLYEAIRLEGALADLSLNSLREGRRRVESGEAMIREGKGEEYRVEVKK
jgi:hypothetical protein